MDLNFLLADQSAPEDIGQAFPSPGPIHPNASNGGMTLRDYFAAHAPVSYEAARHVYGGDGMWNDDCSRAAFFAVWTMLRYEYADAMIEARDEK